MDPSLHQALKGNIVPVHEFLLQGSIVDSSKDVLIHRLRGLCDNADSQPETFSDHEVVLQISKYILTNKVLSQRKKINKCMAEIQGQDRI